MDLAGATLSAAVSGLTKRNRLFNKRFVSVGILSKMSSDTLENKLSLSVAKNKRLWWTYFNC